MRLNKTFIVIIFLKLANSAGAVDNFCRFELAYGISLDIPDHWTILSIETRSSTEHPLVHLLRLA